jgi:hypothetical protein
MKCEKFMRKFMTMDDYRSMGLSMRLHMFICRSCSKEARELSGAMRRLQQGAPFRMKSSISGQVMSVILDREAFSENRITWTNWISIGSLIFLSILLINFSDSFIWLKAVFGADLTVPVSVVLGSIFSLYAMIVTAVNYESMKSVIDNYLKKL